MNVRRHLIFSACCVLLAGSAGATTRLDLVYMPKGLATAAPTTEETLERQACVYSTESPAEIQRIRSLLEGAPKTAIDTPKPWYRAAIFLHEENHGTVRYFFHTRRDEQFIPLHTMSDSVDTMTSIPIGVPEEIFYRMPRALYVPDPSNNKKTWCRDFAPAF